MNYEYYNQLIEYYCPGILAYIYKRTTDVEHGLLASLFKLEQKNKIKIHEDRIEILEKDYTNVTHMEEYMMRSIEHGLISMKIDKLEFGYREEALKKQLFTEDEFAISAETAMLIIMLPILATILLFTENIILSTIAMILVFSPFIMTKYLMIKGNRLPLSSHGKDVYKKLKDLKKYMYINKDDEELKNWKNYKIYSLILDLEDGKYIKEEFNHLVNLTMDKSIVKE